MTSDAESKKNSNKNQMNGWTNGRMDGRKNSHLNWNWNRNRATKLQSNIEIVLNFHFHFALSIRSVRFFFVYARGQTFNKYLRPISLVSCIFSMNTFQYYRMFFDKWSFIFVILCKTNLFQIIIYLSCCIEALSCI